MNYINTFFSDLINFVYPPQCYACDNYLVEKGELVCTNCILEMPRNKYYLKQVNPIEEIFYGRINIIKATACFQYMKGHRIQEIIHNIKYRNERKLAIYMGREVGYELINTSFFKGIDYIIPVPLHKSKFKIRGYNQAELIAKGISEISKIDLISDELIRIKKTSTQTKKNHFERMKNVENGFSVISPSIFEDKHILIIDDVITTGATIEACALSFTNISDCKISFLFLASA